MEDDDTYCNEPISRIEEKIKEKVLEYVPGASSEDICVNLVKDDRGWPHLRIFFNITGACLYWVDRDPGDIMGEDYDPFAFWSDAEITYPGIGADHPRRTVALVAGVAEIEKRVEIAELRAKIAKLQRKVEKLRHQPDGPRYESIAKN